MRVAGINKVLETARSPLIVPRYDDVRDRRTPGGWNKRRAPIEIGGINGAVVMDGGPNGRSVPGHCAILQLNRIEGGGQGRSVLANVDGRDRNGGSIPIGVRGEDSILAGVRP